MKKLLHRHLSRVSRDLWLFLGAVCLIGFSGAVVNSVFNNYLNDTYALTGIQRSIIELPREFPGLLTVFVSALLWFLCTRRLAAFSMLLQGIGLVLIALVAPSFSLMLVWLFVLSMGQHLFIPLNSGIGMELAKEGAAGRRLGQISGVSNLAAILGSFIVFLGFRFLHFTYTASFILAALALFIAALLLYYMTPMAPRPASHHLTFRKEYRLFYWLNILYGTRKQIFLTFAPWVLVTVFRQPTQTLAKLMTIGGILGIGVMPLLGRSIDRFGEKRILAGEALVLIAVCFGYGFAGKLFAPSTALAVTGACFIADQLLMAVGMARATYLKKIAKDPAHVAPVLALGVSIDHVFSITIALVGGVIWSRWGYQYIFVCGAAIALVNFISVLRIRIPEK